jgi:antitoxin VapB
MRTARLFKNGHSQAVRLPREFRFEGDKVYIRKEGDEVILSPYQDRWERFLRSLEMFSDDFSIERNQPSEIDKREWFD